MTGEELSEIVDGPLVNPHVLGRLACNLREESSVHQHNFDNKMLTLTWKELPDVSRCTVSFAGDDARGQLAQIDIHENATISIEASAPVKVTVSQEEGFLCLTRFRAEERP